MASAAESFVQDLFKTKGSVSFSDGVASFEDGRQVALAPMLNEKDEADRELAEKYREAADTKWSRDGAVEIDNDAIVSYSDDGGAYVAAWVWVDDEDAGINRDEDMEICECGRNLKEFHSEDGQHCEVCTANNPDEEETQP